MTDQSRHDCEVRDWIRRRTQHDALWLRGWLDLVEKARGKAAADRLRVDIAARWRAGERGQWAATESR